jgi:conjugative relaxase-like TrwC/TraI family protein
VLNGPAQSNGGLTSAMLSIGKLAAGQANYYLQQARRRVDRPAGIATGVEDYYLAGPEAAGEWIGALTRDLGVSGRVGDDGLHLALRSRSPMTGELLPRRALRVPGFDVTFSAPKSVSVVFGIADERVRSEVMRAHDRAVRDAFGYLERHAAVSRRGRGGHELVRGDGLLAAAFRHRTSRAGDPQLHTHVLIANVTRGQDGRWRALDARRLYIHAKTAGYLYEARLRAELTRRLGVEWQRPHNGIADIVGFPGDVVRAFSRRRAEIEQELRRVGRAGAAAAQVAALETRRQKEYGVTPEQLAPEWRRRAAALGLDAAALEAEVLGRTATGRADERWVDRLDKRLSGPGGLTHIRSVATRRDAIQAWCELMPPGAEMGVEAIEAHVDGLLRSGAFVPVLVPHVAAAGTIRRRDGRLVAAASDEIQYTTPELLAAEQRVIARATEPAAAPVARPRDVAGAIEARPSLATEQADMVRRLALDPRRVSVVVGKAGAGKTFALDAARSAWEASGIEVIGAAVARRAARELEEGAGIVSTSVAALLGDLRRAPQLTLRRRSVLVVDEASLLPTRQLDELLRHVAAADAKVVLVGDHKQLPAILAGGAFLGLARRLGAIQLNENRRQVADWERGALDLVRHGRGAEAIEAYATHGRLIVGRSAPAVHAAMVRDWWNDGDTGDGVMIAFRRADVRELNVLARDLILRAGRLGAESLQIGDYDFATGDRVVLRSNHRRLGIANGDRGTVTRVNAPGGTLDVVVGGREVTLDHEYLARARHHPALVHGYAVTGHVAQGMTVDRALVLGTETLFQEWGYVAMSRGRSVNRFYAVARSPERNEFAPAEGPDDPIADIIAALERSRAEVMASDAGWTAGMAEASVATLKAQAAELRRSSAARTEATVRELRRVRTELESKVGRSEVERRLDASRRTNLRREARQLERRLDIGALGTLATVNLIEDELRQRKELQASARRLVAPPEMLQAIGPRPERPIELRRWCARTAALDADPARGRTRQRLLER